MFDLINLDGGDNYRGIARGGTKYRPVGNPKPITEKAFIVDFMGEVEYTLEDANKGEQEGYFRYMGSRTVGTITEHRWRFV